MEQIKDLKQHDRGKIYIKDPTGWLRLRKKDGATIKYADDLSLYDTEGFNDRYHRFIEKVAKRDNRKIKRDSLVYQKIKTTVIKTYIRVLIKILVDQMLKGNKVLWHEHVFSMHIGNMTPKHWYRRVLRYRYIRAFKGQFPIIVLAVSTRILYSMRTNKQKRTSEKKGLLFLHAFYKKEMSKMISHKIVNDKQKYSDDWNTILKSEARWADNKKNK